MWISGRRTPPGPLPRRPEMIEDVVAVLDDIGIDLLPDGEDDGPKRGGRPSTGSEIRAVAGSASPGRRGDRGR